MSEIAEQSLTEEARQVVEAILGPETMAQASSWAHFMRSSPDPFWQNEAGPYHFAAIPRGMTCAEVGAPPRGGAITGMERLSAALQGPDASLEDRQRALRLLIHIIWGIHQPCHVGNGEDRGANDVPARWSGHRTNLHRVRGADLVEHETLSCAEMVGS